MYYVENIEKFCKFCLKTTPNESDFNSIDKNVQLNKQTKKIYELTNIFSDDLGVFRECEEGSLVCNDCVEQLIKTWNFYEKSVQTYRFKKSLNDQIRDCDSSNEESTTLIRIPTPPVVYETIDPRVYVKNINVLSSTPFSANDDADVVLIGSVDRPFSFLCSKCNEGPCYFLTQSDFLSHISTIHNIPCILCDTCGAVFKTSVDCDTHRLKHFIDCNAPSECVECTAQLPSVQALQFHSLFSHSEGIYCEICLKPSDTLESLASHLEAHIDEKVLLCIYCPLQFRSAGKLNGHIKESHNSRRVSSNSYFNLHCDRENCQEQFSSMDLLRKHKNEKHEMKREGYDCKVCKKTFHDKPSLTEHLETHLSGKCIPVHTTIVQRNIHPNNYKNNNNNKNNQNNRQKQRQGNGNHQYNHVNRNLNQQQQQQRQRNTNNINNNRKVYQRNNNNNNNNQDNNNQNVQKPVKRLLNKGNVHARLG